MHNFIMTHGDDWQVEPMAQICITIFEAIDPYCGELVEITCTPDVSSAQISPDFYSNRT